MQRTPPKPTLIQGQSVSEPDLTSSTTKVGSNSDDFNITMRANKRSRLNDSPVNEPDPAVHPEFTAFKTELLEIFSKWKTGQKQLVTEDSLRHIIKQELGTTIKETIKELVADQLSSINERLDCFHNSLQFFNQKFEEIKSQLVERDSIIANLQADNERLKSNANDLTTRLGVVEQHLRESNIEINGIPEHKSENLANTLINLSAAIGSPLNDKDILQITRIAKLNKDSDRPRSVIAKLQSPRQRDTILAAVVNYNKKNPQDKLSSHHLGIAGHRAPVFVSEHLSPANKQLHAATRKLAKETSYKFVWIRNGRIFVRKDVDHDSIYIRNADTLKRLKNSPPLSVSSQSGN
ncbi:hypothetical protein PYW07_017444 [Mythimna separata]|uniref:FP protein C-terminal domain-containing protein n=1 Tax=Mythimna separata TaxID=271217 RepID=A0AAD7YVG8_MYTSE|nr:hypothetical protein PYW07_015777 [Mythimna separata]KAJ8730406.1 hypothetical protein PYW07_017444 [Mythimna separata]